MKIFFDSIGCRLNQSEVEGFANTFRALGHEIVGNPAEADLAIVNTCAVTVKAAADSRKRLRRAGRKGARRVVATGCWATLYPKKAIDLQGVTDVVINAEKDTLVPDLLGMTAQELAGLHLVREPLPGDRARTRAFIKVQEGCDNTCTYCLTRVARGKSRSRDLQAVRRDIQAAVSGDAKEIVLTGVQLGGWGKDLPETKGLGDLLSAVLEMEGFARLRLSSIEPWDFEPAMLSLWQDQRMCRHLHIPLQSGHDRILKAMGRPISTGSYAELIEKIRNAISDVAITTDVIAGFPGETQDEFNTTRSFVRSMAFSGGHVFSYSPRPGTAAFTIKARLPVKIVKKRNAELRDVFRETGYLYRDRFVGAKSPVLWESSSQTENGQWRLSGLTDNYLRVFAKSDVDLRNRLSLVKIDSHFPERNALSGTILKRISLTDR